jgi:hypothetical protein
MHVLQFAPSVAKDFSLRRNRRVRSRDMMHLYARAHLEAVLQVGELPYDWAVGVLKRLS